MNYHSFYHHYSPTVVSQKDIVLLDPRPGFECIHNEFCKLVEDRYFGDPYQRGAYLTPTDYASMKIVFDPNAKTGFWAPAGNDRRCALEEKIFSELETLLNEEKLYKKELAECQGPKIEDAYGASVAYSRILQHLVQQGLFYNEAFVDASGDDEFQNLGVAYYRSDIYMQTCVVFSSPGHPHITILSIQPQLASSQNELLCTEFWTMYYWAYSLARRWLRTTDLCLPMRMVSLCGYEARMVSAVFSHGYPRAVVKEVGDGKYRGMSPSCKIHISEYRDLSVPQRLDGGVGSFALRQRQRAAEAAGKAKYLKDVLPVNGQLRIRLGVPLFAKLSGGGSSPMSTMVSFPIERSSLASMIPRSDSGICILRDAAKPR